MLIHIHKFLLKNNLEVFFLMFLSPWSGMFYNLMTCPPSWCLHFFVHDCHSIRKKSWEALIVFLFAWCLSKWTIHQTMDRLVRLEGSPIIERRCNVICKVYAQTQWASPASHLPKVQRRCLFFNHTNTIRLYVHIQYGTVMTQSVFSTMLTTDTP